MHFPPDLTWHLVLSQRNLSISRNDIAKANCWWLQMAFMLKSRSFSICAIVAFAETRGKTFHSFFADHPGPRTASHLKEQSHVEQSAWRPFHSASVLHIPGRFPLLPRQAGSVNNSCTSWHTQGTILRAHPEFWLTGLQFTAATAGVWQLLNARERACQWHYHNCCSINLFNHDLSHWLTTESSCLIIFPVCVSSCIQSHLSFVLNVRRAEQNSSEMLLWLRED